MRRCSGSKTFGIEAHDAPPTDFPIQPSRKDGLGTMCKPHWNQYTSALRKAAPERKSGATGDDAPSARDQAKQARAVASEEVVNARRQARKAPSACSKTVGKRTCVVGAEGHAGPHDWPKTATAKAPRQAKAPKVREARAVVAATESLGGRAYTDAVGSDEVQAALEVAAGGGSDDHVEEASAA